MSKRLVATRIAERKPSLGWTLGLTAGKVGFLLLTWSFVTQFGLPSDKPETSVLPNETLAWRLVMSYDVNVIALRGPIDTELEEFLKDVESVTAQDEHDGSSEVYENWPVQDDDETILLEGQCDDSTPIGTIMCFAYAILLILELYILIEFKLNDQMVFMAFVALIQSIVMIAVVANQVPDQTINLWMLNN